MNLSAIQKIKIPSVNGGILILFYIKSAKRDFK